jgi:predicted MFS family arabinose efflux permease
VNPATSNVANLEPHQTAQTHLDRTLVLLMAVATGLAVASNYYAQPLLPQLTDDLHLHGSTAGLIITVTQLGYAVGLVFLLPLGDLFERRRLIVVLSVLSAVTLVGFALSRSAAELMPAAVALGLVSVVAQVLVPFAASLAADDERGRVVGTIMAGLLLGVLVARTAAGYLAELGGWQTVYWVAAALMLVFAVVLRLRLPQHHSAPGLSYPKLLASVVTLVREEPVLRLRMIYGATSFGAFSVFWTTIAFLLAGAPYHYGTGTIGLFGLIGAAGALAANVAGRLADAGHQRFTTGVTSLLLCVSWIPVAVGRHSLIALIIGVVVLDLAVQGLHISNQSQIYALRPDARSRINSAYMTAYFAGGTLGSAVSTLAYGRWGWDAVCIAGAAFGALATLLWIGTARRSRGTAERSRGTAEQSPDAGA